MATESYGRTDDGIAWEVRHELWSGPWRWTMWLPDGRRVESPERYETERQALDAVKDAHRQALAGLLPVETMASLRARAEAAEARAAQAEAAVEAWRNLLLSRVRERCGDPDLHTDRPGAERVPVRRLWRVVSHRGVVSVGATEGQALLRALDAREQRDMDNAISQAKADERHFERAAVDTYLRAQAEAGGDPWMVHVADEIWVGSHRPSHAYPKLST
jgi:hypothetical protein